MRLTKLALLVGVVLLAGLSGCTSQEEPNNQPVAETGDADIQKIVLEEDRIVCYYFVTNGEQGGMSCHPFSEVDGYGG